MEIFSVKTCFKAANVVNHFVASCTCACTVEFRFLKDELDFKITFLSTTSLSGSNFVAIRSLSNLFNAAPKCYSNSHLDFVCEFEIPFSKKEVRNG